MYVYLCGRNAMPQCVQVAAQTISSSVTTAAVLTSLTLVTGNSTAQTALMKTSAQTVRKRRLPESLASSGSV